jgi:OPA family glycerol-3-phosphate transporter-like MFS transporter
VDRERFVARRRQNWIALGLAYGVFYMSRYNLAAISQSVGATFGWSNADYGKVLSAGVVTYGVAVLLNGPITDKLGGKRAILIGAAGAALFNVVFGLTRYASAAVHGSTLLTMCAVTWALNHYFQSFGALSVMKINAAWFHVGERGIFGGIFGIMIQSGRLLAFWLSPFIASLLPWQWCFWIPAAFLVVMCLALHETVVDAPERAELAFATGDEEHDAKSMLRSRVLWTVVATSMCIGMVRNAIDHWWVRYMGTVFHKKPEDLLTFAPYVLVTWGAPIVAVIGGIAAGNVSDRVFGSRRAPVAFFAFVGQAIALLVLWRVLHSAWLGAFALLAITFFVQCTHVLVAGALSMDLGGKTTVATAAGLVDGAQYLAAGVIALTLGELLDRFDYDVWPLAALPFAVIGAILLTTIWRRSQIVGAPNASTKRS